MQIPKIHWELSTKRILTMDFAEGGQVNDQEYIRKHAINVNEVRKHPYLFIPQKLIWWSKLVSMDFFVVS